MADQLDKYWQPENWRRVTKEGDKYHYAPLSPQYTEQDRLSQKLLTDDPRIAEEFLGQGENGRVAYLMTPSPAEYAAQQEKYASGFREKSPEELKAMTPYDRLLYEQQKLYGGVPKIDAIFSKAKDLTESMLNRMDPYTAQRLDYGELYRKNLALVAKYFEDREKLLYEGLRAAQKEATELEKWQSRQRYLDEQARRREEEAQKREEQNRQKAAQAEYNRQQQERWAGYRKAMELFNKHAINGEIEDDEIRKTINDILTGSGNPPLQEKKYGRYLPFTKIKMWEADSGWRMPPAPGRASLSQTTGTNTTLADEPEESGEGIPPGAVRTGRTYRGKDVYKLPDGQLWVKD